MLNCGDETANLFYPTARTYSQFNSFTEKSKQKLFFLEKKQRPAGGGKRLSSQLACLKLSSCIWGKPFFIFSLAKI